MELRKRLSSKYIFVGVYVLAFLIYVVYGLQPAEATASYSVTGEVEIPSVGLAAEVTELGLEEGQLKTPDSIVGSYKKAENKTLLIGHATGVFRDLNQTRLGDIIKYNDNEYKVVKLTYTVKEVINMNELLAPADTDTLVVMTCAGKMLDGGDATHRLIVTAVR